MKFQFKSKYFGASFAFGILIFTVLNGLSYLHNVCPATIDDCGWSFGFPMHFYLESGLLTFKEILWLGLVIDILSAFGFSLLIGLLFDRLWSKVNMR
ncbi:MAG: hypothetical protein ACK4S4_06880 [Pyrinomonadaceae bacterium]